MIWETSENNKDEFMTLNKSSKVVGNNNYVCGQFQYKSDMAEALYYLPVKCDDNGFNAISLWLADQSILSGDEDKVSHITNWSPDVIIWIRTVENNKEKRYIFDDLKSLSRIWHQYDIPFTSFRLEGTEKGSTDVPNIKANTITHIGFSMKYYYMDQYGKASPLYTMDNPVLADNIYFGYAESFKATMKEKFISKVGDYAYIDNFEGYQSDSEMLDYWSFVQSDLEFEARSLSNEVSSLGGTHSMRMTYKANVAPAYYMPFTVNSGVSSKGITLDMKCDGSPTVTIKLYTVIDGKENVYKATFMNINTAWTRYQLGLGRIYLENSTTATTLGESDIEKISRVTISITGPSEASEVKNLYIDNFSFDGTITSLMRNTKELIA